MNYTVLNLLEEEISFLQNAIDRHKGVGCFYDNCRKWQLWLDAYQELHCKIIRRLAQEGR